MLLSLIFDQFPIDNINNLTNNNQNRSLIIDTTNSNTTNLIKSQQIIMFHRDAVDENKLIFCCAVCCANIAILPSCGALGCSGKIGLCCCNMECCCKPGAPCLTPFGVCGCKPECDGCSILNLQCQALCAVINAAIPCNSEVPLAVTILGMSLYPKCGFCLTQKEMMERD